MMHAKELPALLLEPNWAAQDPEQRRLLALDLRGGAADPAALNAWLSRQAVPSLVLADPGLQVPGADLLVHDPGAAEKIMAAAAENPTAAALLVQTTRITSQLPMAAALQVESLAYATLQAGDEFAAWLARNRRPPRSAAKKPVLLMSRKGDELHIRLNAPENRNALSTRMRDALSEALQLLAVDRRIRRARITGAGPAFCAGGDLTEFGSSKNPALAHQIRQLRMPARYLAEEGARCHFHLHGPCMGAGIELAAFAGRISAAEDAVFQLPEVSMGLIPGAGGCVSLTRRIGRQKTNWLAITGLRLNAEEALELGLIDEITSHG